MSHRASHKSGRSFFLYSVAIILAIALFLPAVNAYAGTPASQPELVTIVRCDPDPPDAGSIGVSDVVVDIYIEGIVGLYGVDLTISFFDTTIAQVVDQSGDAGVQIEPLDTFFVPDFVVANTADNTAGTIQYAASQVSPSEPVDGSGPVARITFTGLQVDSFNIAWGLIELTDIDGALIPFTAQPCTITFTNPLAVTLNAFEATAQADHVLVAWETVQELDNRGFNLYRGTSPAGADRQLNVTLIPSQSQGSPNGFVYTWEDRSDLVPDTVYYYWLEDVSLSGVTTLHGPVSVTFFGPTAVTLSGLEANQDRGTAWPLVLLILTAGIGIWGITMARLCSRSERIIG